jgi:hypothetical protein
MRLFISLALLGLFTSFSAQETITYPYNPDGNADGSITVPDLQDLLGNYGGAFSPSEITLNGEMLSTVITDLQNTINNLIEENESLHFVAPITIHSGDFCDPSSFLTNQPQYLSEINYDMGVSVSKVLLHVNIESIAESEFAGNTIYGYPENQYVDGRIKVNSFNGEFESPVFEITQNYSQSLNTAYYSYANNPTVNVVAQIITPLNEGVLNLVIPTISQYSTYLGVTKAAGAYCPNVYGDINIVGYYE